MTVQAPLPPAPAPRSGRSFRAPHNPYPLFLPTPSPSLLPHLSCFSAGKAKPDSSLSKSRTCRHLWEGGKRKSQRSFKISAFEYSKLRNARHVDRPCGRLHSDLPAHYLLSEKKKKKAHVKGQNRFAQICPSMLPPVPSLPPQPCPLLCSVVPRRLRDALGLAWLEGRESAGMRTRKRTRWTGSETPLPPPPLGFHSRVPCRISLEKCLQS